MGFARYYGCTIIKITPTQPETRLNAGIPNMDMPSVWFSISIDLNTSGIFQYFSHTFGGKHWNATQI